MNEPRVYEIRVRGTLTERWSGWFEGLEIEQTQQDETILKGLIIDQAALMGVLTKIHSLNLELISVQRLTAEG